MYDRYFQTFNKKVLLAEEEREVIEEYLTIKKIRKRQYILQEGDICKSVAFVETGAVRLYKANEDGTAHIIQFALEGQYIADLYSFLTNEPSVYNIDAIEDTELVLISKAASDELCKRSAKYLAYILIVTSEFYTDLERRLTYINSLTVVERYQDLITHYPDIIQRLPQHMIASYMGLTPETLSRIRKKISTSRKI